MAHVRQPRPDSGLGFQVKSVKRFMVFPLITKVDLLPYHDVCLSLCLCFYHSQSSPPGAGEGGGVTIVQDDEVCRFRGGLVFEAHRLLSYLRLIDFQTAGHRARLEEQSGWGGGGGRHDRARR